ncbi:beclin 1-associated autophagy-related key regulator-like [Babylonia areolata]|uniref:beclin 1-associated autophagy-related key regulator-like n=1 Tax=Babylonia areolata TaxID=304850 RepID=UPI003FD092E1
MADERYESDEPYDSFLYSAFGDGLAVAVERCPLCLRSRRPFHCKECVKSGNFSRSTDESERYCDLQKRLDLASEERVHLVKRIQQSVAAKEERASKRDEIKELKEKISLLQHSIKEARKRKAEGEKYRSELSRVNRHNADKLQRSHASVPKMRATYDGNLKKMRLRAQDLEERNAMLRDERHRVIDDLVTFIFPVVELTAEGASSSSLSLEASSLLMSTARALSEASQLTYMSGRWVHTDRYGNTLIKIVESVLPGNGDYSAGVTSERQELASLADDNQRYTASNPTYAVVSGLCHTTQLLQILSAVLMVSLPRKISYSTFGCNDFSEKQLQQAVSRLNHNMLHLCFSQGVDTSQITARHTMHNLLLLLQADRLGRSLPYKEQPQMVEVVNDGCESEEDVDKDELEAPQEWDFVSRGDIPEMPIPMHESASWTYSPAAYAGQVLAGTQSTASDLITSAAASVTSLWRTATGGRRPSDGNS